MLAQPATSNNFADYKPTVGFYFPGQGAQTVGMAKVRPAGSVLCVLASPKEASLQQCYLVQDVVGEVPAAKELFQKAADILGYDLLKICTEGKK